MYDKKSNVIVLSERVAKAVATMPRAADALFGKRHYAPVLGGHSSVIQFTVQDAARRLTVDESLSWMDRA